MKKLITTFIVTLVCVASVFSMCGCAPYDLLGSVIEQANEEIEQALNTPFESLDIGDEFGFCKDGYYIKLSDHICVFVQPEGRTNDISEVNNNMEYERKQVSYINDISKSYNSDYENEESIFEANIDYCLAGEGQLIFVLDYTKTPECIVVQCDDKNDIKRIKIPNGVEKDLNIDLDDYDKYSFHPF